MIKKFHDTHKIKFRFDSHLVFHGFFFIILILHFYLILQLFSLKLCPPIINVRLSFIFKATKNYQSVSYFEKFKKYLSNRTDILSTPIFIQKYISFHLSKKE